MQFSIARLSVPQGLSMSMLRPGLFMQLGAQCVVPGGLPALGLCRTLLGGGATLIMDIDAFGGVKCENARAYLD